MLSTNTELRSILFLFALGPQLAPTSPQVLVLGVHPSGTSIPARVLDLLGVHL